MKSMLLALILLCPQQTDPLWTTVWRFKNDNVTQPDCRIYISVRAVTEGDAVIKAFKYIQDKLVGNVASELVFVEAQKREDGK